jgi:hypothetical protein
VLESVGVVPVGPVVGAVVGNVAGIAVGDPSETVGELPPGEPVGGLFIVPEGAGVPSVLVVGAVLGTFWLFDTDGWFVLGELATPGLAEGEIVGTTPVGLLDGFNVGEVGLAVGVRVGRVPAGLLEGLKVGTVGLDEGVIVGASPTGLLEGFKVGTVGLAEGVKVGVSPTGLLDGLKVGAVGLAEGVIVGKVAAGLLEGFWEGLALSGLTDGAMVGLATAGLADGTGREGPVDGARVAVGAGVVVIGADVGTVSSTVGWIDGGSEGDTVTGECVGTNPDGLLVVGTAPTGDTDGPTVTLGAAVGGTTWSDGTFVAIVFVGVEAQESG